jgi:hypothetical protein
MPPVTELTGRPLASFEGWGDYYAGYNFVVENSAGEEVTSKGPRENVIIYSPDWTPHLYDVTPNQVYAGQ